MTAAAIDKTRVRRSFAAASETYDSVARLQRTVGIELLNAESLLELSGTVMDLGCGTGFITEQLMRRCSAIDRIVAVDLATDMLRALQDKLLPVGRQQLMRPPICVGADAEHLPFIDESIDAIVSNLALQWCHALDRVFNDFARVLKPNGFLLFSTFGPDTLSELKSAWAAVDDFTHVNLFYAPEVIKRLLIEANFTDIRIDRRGHHPVYPSVYTLMLELKQIGAHNVNQFRNKRLTGKGRLLKMMDAYERYRLDDGLPACFDVLQIMARKI